MIENLHVQGFKRFASVELTLKPLTVMTGLNGTGKSTLIQALLLARQMAENPGCRYVKLNGPYELALGEADDVLHPAATSITIDFVIDGTQCRYVFEPPEEGRALHLLVADQPEEPCSDLAGEGMTFTYLAAERLGPRDQLAVTADEPGRAGIGVRGEYTAQVLALNDTAEVREPLRHRDTEKHRVITLRTQVESWVSDIIRPIRISAQWPAGINASLIRFESAPPLRPSGPRSGDHAGFGTVATG
jgi:hypothetical protein